MTSTSTMTAQEETLGSARAALSATRRFFSTSTLGAVAAAALVTAVVALAVGGTGFYTSATLGVLTQFIALPLIVGVFAAVGLLAGVVDLSVGAMVGFSAALFSTLGSHGWSAWSAAAVALAACLALGAVNALAVVRFEANSIAATTGMMAVLSGLTLAMVGNTPPTYLNQGLFTFAMGQAGPLSNLFLVGAAAAVVVAVVIAFTRAGRHIQATGGDPVAAARAGIGVARLRSVAFLLSAFGAGIAGILYIGLNGASSPTAGQNMTFEVFAAFMIGGFSIVRGGVGNPLGGLLGLLIVGAVGVLLDMKQLDSNYLDMFLGAALIGAVLVDRLRGGERFD